MENRLTWVQASDSSWRAVSGGREYRATNFGDDWCFVVRRGFAGSRAQSLVHAQRLAEMWERGYLRPPGAFEDDGGPEWPR
jgi:hypothetical protein